MLSVHPDALALIFDCDGTLVDSLPKHLAAWRETLTTLGRSLPDGFLGRHTGMTTEQIVAIYNREFADDLDAAVVSREKNERVYEALLETREIPEIAGLARRYAGKLPMAVVSGGKARNVLRTLKATGLESLFPVVLTADDDIRPKPAPDLFLEAARRLGVTPVRCQVFEDGDPGLEAAREAGMIATDVRPVLARPAP